MKRFELFLSVWKTKVLPIKLHVFYPFGYYSFYLYVQQLIHEQLLCYDLLSIYYQSSISHYYFLPILRTREIIL